MINPASQFDQSLQKPQQREEGAIIKTSVLQNVDEELSAKLRELAAHKRRDIYNANPATDSSKYESATSNTSKDSTTASVPIPGMSLRTNRLNANIHSRLRSSGYDIDAVQVPQKSTIAEKPTDNADRSATVQSTVRVSNTNLDVDREMKYVRPTRSEMLRSAPSQSRYIKHVLSEIKSNETESYADIVRHGFPSKPPLSMLSILEQSFLVFFCEDRHDETGKPKKIELWSLDWRMKERLKTVSAALVLCLNIGVDPPDIVKTNPCAKLECFVDPFSLPASKALEQIGKNLQSQYGSLSLRTRYKQYLDPSVEELRKLCASQRRNARDERILFHYNGHGVPKPTPSGELWVFNKSYTQYIPVSMYDLQGWLGSPCINVYDCSAAGNILLNYCKFAKQRDNERNKMSAAGSAADGSDQIRRPSLHLDDIQLAACGPYETLPVKPDLPADLFTSCLTSPIEIAVKWFVLENPLKTKITLDMVSKIPGRLQDRRTPLGELNWIFTAVTDTIAWTSLPKYLFKRLFRQDLMVAALFRNFLFAERIMRVHHCTPMSNPPLPKTHYHPMWSSWDMAVDHCLVQLPQLLDESTDEPYVYKHSPFFSEQLTAFELWLEQGFVAKSPPCQLPIVLQVLLSQVHRLRALVLLSKFLDLGPWAVSLALSIGVFPYVLKLLQSPVVELKPVLVFLWARIIAVDSSCQVDLLKDSGYMYFVSALPLDAVTNSSNLGEHRAMAAFILSQFSRKFKQGQAACLSANVLSLCSIHFDDPDPLIRQWTALCIGSIWEDYDPARQNGDEQGIWKSLIKLLDDYVPEVRAATLFSLSTYLGMEERTLEIELRESCIAAAACGAVQDESTIVRKELTIFLSKFVTCHLSKMAVALFEFVESFTEQSSGSSECSDSNYPMILKVLLILQLDPQPLIRSNSMSIMDAIVARLRDHPLRLDFERLIGTIKSRCRSGLNSDKSNAIGLLSPINNRPKNSPLRNKTKSYSFSRTIRQSAGLAALGLRNLSIGSPTESSAESSSPGSERHQISRSALATQKDINESEDNFNTTAVHLSSARKGLPIVSEYIEWSANYFQEPQMKARESQEPGSIQYNERLWRQNRNEKLLRDAVPHIEEVNENWRSVSWMFRFSKQVENIIFHQFEDTVVGFGENNLVHVANWRSGTFLNKFTVGRVTCSKVTDIKLINEEDIALLMIASNDGSLRLYKSITNTGEADMVTAWRGLPELAAGIRSKVVIDWQQEHGRTIIAGNSRLINVWDASREKCIAEIPTRSRNAVSFLTSEHTMGDVIIGGFDNGFIRYYDIREKPRNTFCKLYKEHSHALVGLRLQNSGNRELVSASANGEVKFWDVRGARSIETIMADSSGLDHMDIHNDASFFATYVSVITCQS